ncbi:MAG: terminase gpA endonuclease subunit, partial [Opitutaceae bacterium]
MPPNPRSLKPAELIRLVNSTTVGSALTERALYRHRQAAGRHIGDDQTVDLPRYVAWLLSERRSRMDVAKKQKQPKENLRRAGQDKRETEAAKQRDQSLSVRDIGEIPACVNPERREKCGKSLRLFLETYFEDTFRLQWSNVHKRAIASIERAVRHGQKHMSVMPRGFGKTSLALRAMIWAFFFGHTAYAVLLAATSDQSEDLLGDLKTILETNDMLDEDFPEFTRPIRALENLSNRCAGQVYHGRPTKIAYRKDRIVFAFLENYPHTGGVFRVGALSGKAMRGFNHTKPDGSVIRPSFFLCDDPQTDESALSFTQTNKREKLLMATIGCMAGPDEQLGGVLCATVIEADDLTCRMMDREKHFDWLYTIAPLVYEWPDKSAAPYWEQYEKILRECYAKAQNDDGDIDDDSLDISPATEYYRENQAVMDNGAVVAWGSCYVAKAGEISAIQHAYNLKIRLGDDIFEKEYQNNPLPTSDGDEALTEKELLGAPSDPVNFPGRLSNKPRGDVPPTADHVVCFVDIHKKLLFWLVAAFETDGFGAHVIEYGAYPDPGSPEFRMANVRTGLKSVHRGCSEEAAIYAGLKTLLETGGEVRRRKIEPLLGRAWRREDGAELTIRHCYIDTGYQKDAVEQFAHDTKFRGVVQPSKGRPYVNRSFDETPTKKGYSRGDHWYVTTAQGKHLQRLALYDTDHWKTFA